MSERIDDGFKTLIAFSLASSVLMYEKSVTPPGIAAGGATDTTTMRNTAWRTRAPKKLKSLENSSIVVAYDPAVYDQIAAMISKNQSITITFPDNSTLVFWGWIDTFTPNEITEGEQATANVTIIPSNMDASKAEVAPVHTNPSV